MVETPDPTAELVEPAVPAPPAQLRRSFAPALAGGMLAALIGFGLAQVVPKGWPIASTASLEAKLATQTADLQTLKARLDKLGDGTAPAPDKPLTDRVTALEGKLAALPPPPDLAALTGRMDAIDQKLTSTPTADATTLAQLRADLDALKANGMPATLQAQMSAAIDAKLAQADARLAKIAADAEALSKSTARTAALHQLQAALDTGAPYTAALADLADLTAPPALATNAQAGLPSLQSLRDSFPDAARAALDASLRAAMGQSWSDRVGAFLRGQTGARSLTPHAGTDPDAVLSRAEADLATGDLAATLTELQALPPAGQTALAPWLARAQARADAIAAVKALLTSAGQ